MRLALAAGLALLLGAVALVLSGSPARVLATNAVPLDGQVAMLHGPQTVCQPELELPHDVTAVRLTLESAIGPRVLVTASSAQRVLASGTRGSGWTGADVTVPVRYGAATVPHTTLCVTLGEGREPILMLGDTSSPRFAAVAGIENLGGRVRVEYLTAGASSWWSLALPVARRLGLGRAPAGTWVGGLILALMLAVATLASRLALRELGPAGAKTPRRAVAADNAPTGRLGGCVRVWRRVPSAAWLCAAIACLNAAAWSLLSPPFQVPDEPAHFAYVQQLVQAHRLPYTPAGATYGYSIEEQTALADLRQGKVQFMPSEGTIDTTAQQRKLEHDLAQPLPRQGSGYAGTATSEPPLYYALEAIPYVLGSSGSLLDRLELMRLFSCAFAGLTALFAFMFVREALPGVRWAWTVGGLSVALTPLLAFMSGAVNPDGMLAAVSAALFYLLARAFRRGLGMALAGAICAVTLVGVFTKLNFFGLVPGILLGLLLSARRAPDGSRRAVRRVAATLALSAGAIVLATAVGPLSHTASANLISGTLPSAASAGNELSYAWQFFLPRLPGMANYFPGVATTRQLWFDGLVGLYGFADTEFPNWAYEVALIPAALVALPWLRALVAGRAALRRRALELVVYVALGAGLLALVGFSSYTADVIAKANAFWEPRYLLPLLALFAAALALAARGAGRRLGPIVGVAIVVLVLGHDVFSQLLVVSRYYN